MTPSASDEVGGLAHEATCRGYKTGRGLSCQDSLSEGCCDLRMPILSEGPIVKTCFKRLAWCDEGDVMQKSVNTTTRWVGIIHS